MLSFPSLDVLHVGRWKNGRKQEEETRDPHAYRDSLKVPIASEEKVSLENLQTASQEPQVKVLILISYKRDQLG